MFFPVDLWSVSWFSSYIHSATSLGLLPPKTNGWNLKNYPEMKGNIIFQPSKFCIPAVSFREDVFLWKVPRAVAFLGCKADAALCRRPTLSIQCSSSWDLIKAMARSMNLLPMVLLALGAWMLSSLTSQSGFVMNTATPRGSKVAMRGFKDDFYAWKETLSSEDQALLLKQAQNASWPRNGKVLTNIWGCMPLW